MTTVLTPSTHRRGRRFRFSATWKQGRLDHDRYFIDLPGSVHFAVHQSKADGKWYWQMDVCRYNKERYWGDYGTVGHDTKELAMEAAEQRYMRL